MRTLEYTFWQDGEFFLGHLNDYPDYETQGYSKDELIENLKDLLVDLESEQIPFIRRVEELVLS
jgi:predicted RNase H-like HicB family nuclease